MCNRFIIYYRSLQTEFSISPISLGETKDHRILELFYVSKCRSFFHEYICLYLIIYYYFIVPGEAKKPSGHETSLGLQGSAERESDRLQVKTSENSPLCIEYQLPSALSYGMYVCVRLGI